MLLPSLVNDVKTPGNHFRLVRGLQSLLDAFISSFQMLGYGLISSILDHSKEQVVYHNVT